MVAPIRVARESAAYLLLIGFLVVFFADETRGSSLLVGYASISPTQTSTWVAKELGLFGRYGPDAEIIFLGSGTRAAQALLSDNIPGR
jgi:ABC-type nitrate/sulfonate/bicarbonate transport system substrate-binding protein